MKPNLNEEKKLRQRGYQRIVGLDEAGRGPLAGPVVAGAVLFKPGFNKSKLEGVKDSKQLTEKQREKFYEILTKQPDIEWGMGKVSEKVIDRINILEATKLAMARAVSKLKEPDFLILDGNFSINSEILQKSIVKADEKVFSCACASIIAKVARDRMMRAYHKKYPVYNFASHKGYPTKLHRAMLKKYGPCAIHRNSFSPLKT